MYIFKKAFLFLFQWNRYMRCDGSPDPTVQGEINTYINLRLEDTDHDDVESVFKASELDTKVTVLCL